MSVHYKFKSALSYDTITFDGLHISVRDLKKAILQQKQIGKATDFDLQITNAQSNEGNIVESCFKSLSLYNNKYMPIKDSFAFFHSL